MEGTGAEAVDFPPSGSEPTNRHPFKGNMDLDRRAAPADRTGPVPVVFVTVTNNSGGGQPGRSRTCEVCGRSAIDGVPLFLDACRFAENAWFIKTREPGQGTPGLRHRA